MKSIDAKLVVLGSQGVGKTSVVVRYVSNTFTGHLSPTIGASFFTCKMMVDNYRLRIQVWDTAGQERFRAMAPMYYRKSNAAILVYDITSLESFDDMKSWVQELQKNTDGDLAMCVFGNKCDLEDQRQVDNDLAQQFAASIGAQHFQVSALSSQGVEDAFLFLARSLITIYENCPEDNPFTCYIDNRKDPLSLKSESEISENSGNTASPAKGGCC